MKKLVAFILVLTLLFSFVVIPTHAESIEDTVAPALENNIAVDSTNSFGGLLSQTINAEMKKQLENNGFNVFSVEYSEGEALVELEALQDCTLFVGIYSEDGTKLVTSQNIEVTRDDTLITLTFDTAVVPTYFTIQAYLINTDDLKPLCKVYTSNMYTQEMQEFLSKTTDDFESEKVLQLDDDKTNNFAVYNDTVEIIEENLEMTVIADEENGIYTITNPTDEVKALQVGDIFSYTYDNGEVLIVKIASISTDENGTITYTEGELELEDVFDYIKVDSTISTQEANVDDTDLEGGITYEGLFSESTTFGLDEGLVGKFSHRYEFKNYEVCNKDDFQREDFELPEVQGSINGSIGIDLSVGLKLYQTLKSISVEIKFDYEASFDFTVSGSIMGKIPLGSYEFSPALGLLIRVTPSMVGIVSASASFTAKLYGSIGFNADSASGITNLTTIPKVSVELKGEIKVFFGISLIPEIKLISQKLAMASVNAVVGVEMIGTTNPTLSTDDTRHYCAQCIEGEMKGVLNLSFGVKLLNSEKFSFDFTLVNLELKICDFYYSLYRAEYDFTTCPYKEYKLTVNVKDGNGKNLKDITVNIGSKSDTTNTFGNASVFLPNGSYTVSIVNDKYIPISRVITINDAPQKIDLSVIDSFSSGSIISAGVNKLSLGDYHTAVITEDGSLYIWGSNGEGQLGNGTTTNSSIPQKIMDNVVSVSLGNLHSAAITKDGSLYTWGDNIYGQLGNGTTTDSKKPVKIMDGVASVSLGTFHSAAITKDGSLYTWGRNGDGQLGNGTTTDSKKPVKIMDGVASVSLGFWNSAAITKDGELFTWGWNNYGQLGDGTTTNSKKPVKIMNNVASVSIGEFHGAAITKNGILFTWGRNDYGQLGDGTTADSLIPKKIMDNVVIVSLGYFHSAAITRDGKLYTWGSGNHGKLGNGTTNNGLKPQKIMDKIIAVSSSGYNSAAITKDGNLYIWGRNNSGQLGNGLTKDSYIPVKIIIPQYITYSLKNAKTNLNEFSNLIPNFIYNYYAMESNIVTNPLNPQNLKYIGQAVSDEYGNLTLPEYTADIASTEPTIVLKEFARVSGELEYLISTNNTAIITGCTAENAVSIPDKLGDYTPTAIANMAFEGCYNLTNVTLAGSITEIADGIFLHQENITLHSSCKNDNTYFEEFATSQEIGFSEIHNYGESVLSETPTAEKDGSVISTCNDCNHNETLSLPCLKFKPALAIADGKVLIKFKFLSDILANSVYENISVTLNGESVYPSAEGEYSCITAIVDSKNCNSKFSANIVAEVCGQSFSVNCSERVINMVDFDFDKKFNVIDLLRIKKDLISMKECDISGDDISDASDLTLLRHLLFVLDLEAINDSIFDGTGDNEVDSGLIPD